MTVDVSKTVGCIHQNAPWYQGGVIVPIEDQKEMFKTREVEENQEFDWYEKNILTGTRWISNYNDKREIEFVKKEHVPFQNE